MGFASQIFKGIPKEAKERFLKDEMIKYPPYKGLHKNEKIESLIITGIFTFCAYKILTNE